MVIKWFTGNRNTITGIHVYAWMHCGTHMEVLSSFQVPEVMQGCILSHDAGVCNSYHDNWPVHILYSVLLRSHICPGLSSLVQEKHGYTGERSMEWTQKPIKGQEHLTYEEILREAVTL